MPSFCGLVVLALKFLLDSFLSINRIKQVHPVCLGDTRQHLYLVLFRDVEVFTAEISPLLYRCGPGGPFSIAPVASLFPVLHLFTFFLLFVYGWGMVVRNIYLKLKILSICETQAKIKWDAF